MFLCAMLIGSYCYGQSAGLKISNSSSTTVYVTMYAYVAGSGTWGTGCSIKSNQITVPGATTYIWLDYYDFEYGTSGTGPAVGWDALSTTFTTPVGAPPPPFINFTWTDAIFQVNNLSCPNPGGSATISRPCGTINCYGSTSSATTSPGGCISGAWTQSCIAPITKRDVTITF